MKDILTKVVLLGALVLGSTGATNVQCPAEEKVWTIGLANDDRGVADISKDTGEILGGDLEKVLIPEVCKHAGKTCKIVAVQNSQCNGNKRGRGFPGTGILSGFVDACARFSPTLERMSGLKFTLPYAMEPVVGFFVLHGNPHHFNPHGGKFVVGVKDGSVGGPQCLNRHHKVFTEVKSIFTLDLKKALEDGVVDAIAIEIGGPDDKSGLEQIGKKIRCSEGGMSMFTLKSSAFTSWWNPAFKAIVEKKKYHHICKKLKNPEWPCLTKIGKAIKMFEKNPLLSHNI